MYGFDMSCIKKQAMMEPLVDTVDQNQIVTNCQLLKVMAYFSTKLSFVFVLYLFNWQIGLNPFVYLIYVFQTMDISKMSSGDASFTVPFKLVAERNDFIHALVAYFNVSFTKCHKLMGFSTGLSVVTFYHPKYACLAPFFKQSGSNECTHNLLFAGPRSKSTHWKQTVLYLEDVVTICEGETLSGSMTVANNKKNPRDIDITLKYAINGNRCKVSRTQHYKMR